MEDAVPLHFALRSDAYIADTIMTARGNKYPWLDKGGKRWNMTDKETIEWKVNLKDSEFSKEQQPRVYDLIEEKLCDEVPFFVCLYAIEEGQKTGY